MRVANHLQQRMELCSIYCPLAALPFTAHGLHRPSIPNNCMPLADDEYFVSCCFLQLHFPVTSTYRAFDAEAAQATEDGWKPEDAQMALWGPKVR